MEIKSISLSKQKFLFLLGITIIYITLVVCLDFLQGDLWRDEIHFWAVSLVFSDRLLPSIDNLRDYDALNTPLPFIIFGGLEYLFHEGVLLGRLLNLILSLTIVFIIGWPRQDKRERAILCLMGLLIYPYYLPLSGRLYTEIIACFWVIMGFISYLRNRHLLSSIAFILAIASRQYMIAFPAAIATYEFIIAIAKAQRLRKINLVAQWRWLLPLIAVLSIFGWIWLFQGLAPETAISNRAPEVQETTWTVQPGAAINFLAVVSFYIVIPEFILFQPWNKLKTLKQQWRKITFIAASLLLCFLIFPPLLVASGQVIKIAKLLPQDSLKMILFYSLSLLTCVRFSQPNLMFLIVLFNSLIMIKTYPGGDKYVFPLVVIFWYLKSVGLEEKFAIFKQQDVVAVKEHTSGTVSP